MKLINIPFLIITTSLVIGINIGYHIDIHPKVSFIFLLVAIIFLVIFWFRASKTSRSSSNFGILSILTFSMIGITLVQIHNPKNQNNHYSNLILNDLGEEYQRAHIQFTYKERLKPSEFYYKYIIDVEILNSNEVDGKILLSLPKATCQNLPKIGERWIATGKLKPVSAPLNPCQFDYASYLSKLYVYHQFIPDPIHLKRIGIQKSVYRFADQVRSDIVQKLSRYGFNTKQLTIINALLLGQRQDIDQDTLNDYRNAGAVHILAVSGLHVGVLMFIFNFLLKPLNLLKRKGKIIKTVVIISLLWTFAIVAGLSPSILRAATMFSFLLIGLQYRSKISTYNSLCISLFVLLCFQPLLLFSVGFQLSYLAVFAILWIQPLLARYYLPKFQFDKIMWNTFTVTLAAQLGLLPLTLFYFHQFPSLFFIANLLIIPILGLILGMGVLIVLLAEIELVPPFLAKIFGSCIDMMNIIVHWVASQENFIFSNVTFSWRMLLLSYILIVLFVVSVQKLNRSIIIALGSVFAIFLINLIVEKELQYTKEELIIFNNPGKTILGIQQNRTLQVYTKDSVTTKTYSYLLYNYITTNNSKFIGVEKIKNAYSFQEKMLFIIDTSAIYQLDSFHPDILLLSGSPKIHLGHAIKKLKPKQIIADASNWKNYLDRWEKTCEQLQVPFHRTDIQGAFILGQ